MRLKKTERGFKRGDFMDYYDKPCSIQESSLATCDCIWLGINEQRMHIDKKIARQLVMHLNKFIDTGRL